jgi:hypothetical protein
MGDADGKTGRIRAGEGDKPLSMRERMARVGVPLSDEMADAWDVVCDEMQRRCDADPRNGYPKFSLARMDAGDWACSLNNWSTGYGLSKFSPNAREALLKLAVALARGEEWKPLPTRGKGP